MGTGLPGRWPWTPWTALPAHRRPPQEAQRAEAEKRVPAQLHPLAGLEPHDADRPALLQVRRAPSPASPAPSPCTPTATLPPTRLRKGLTFVSVHDCFWTHAADVPVMNQVRPRPVPTRRQQAGSPGPAADRPPPPRCAGSSLCSCIGSPSCRTCPVSSYSASAPARQGEAPRPGCPSVWGAPPVCLPRASPGGSALPGPTVSSLSRHRGQKLSQHIHHTRLLETLRAVPETGEEWVLGPQPCAPSPAQPQPGSPCCAPLARSQLSSLHPCTPGPSWTSPPRAPPPWLRLPASLHPWPQPGSLRRRLRPGAGERIHLFLQLSEE